MFNSVIYRSLSSPALGWKNDKDTLQVENIFLTGSQVTLLNWDTFIFPFFSIEGVGEKITESYFFPHYLVVLP